MLLINMKKSKSETKRKVKLINARLFSARLLFLFCLLLEGEALGGQRSDINVATLLRSYLVPMDFITEVLKERKSI